MKKIKNKVIGIFVSIYVVVSLMSSVQAKEHLILVLPSGGALGKIPAAFLMKLEEETQKPTYELFDEYFGSSIGAQMISLLTIHHLEKGRPLTAKEVDNFLDRAFKDSDSFFSHLETFCNELGPSRDSLLGETQRPVRILATKVNQADAELVTFGPESHGELKLSEIACASSTDPLFWEPQEVVLGQGISAPFIDSSSIFYGGEIRRWHPLYEGFKEFTRSGKFKEGDTATIFFFGNGWASLENDEFTRQVVLKAHDQRDISVKIFHTNVNISPALDLWIQGDPSFNKVASMFFPEKELQKLAVRGVVPPSKFYQATAEAVENSKVFKEMIDYLKMKIKSESTEAKPSSSEEGELNSAKKDETSDSTMALGMEWSPLVKTRGLMRAV